MVIEDAADVEPKKAFLSIEKGRKTRHANEYKETRKKSQ